MSVYLASGGGGGGVGKGRMARRALEERNPAPLCRGYGPGALPGFLGTEDFQAPVCRELYNHTAAIAWENQSSWPRMNHHHQ